MTRTAPKNRRTAKPQAATSVAGHRQLPSGICKKNLSPGTTIDMPGNSSVAYANYASVVKSVYDQAWTLPDNIANDDATRESHA